MGCTCSAHVENEKYVPSLGQKASEEVPAWKLRRRWQDTITRDVTAAECAVVGNVLWLRIESRVGL